MSYLKASSGNHHSARSRRHRHSRSSRALVRPTRLASAACAFFLAGSGVFLLLASGATASTLDGTATIETPESGTLTFPAASTAQFTVGLPTGAACTGDTATDGYHVYSYLVPRGTNVATVTFVGQPSTGYGLFTSTGSYVGPINTAPTTGVVPTLPINLEWGSVVASHSWLSALLASGGVWEAGLACANSSGAVTDYWNTEVTFSASASDSGGFTWSASTQTTTATTTTTGGTTATTATGGATATTATGGTTATTATGGTTATTSASGTSTTTTAPDPSSVNAAAGMASGTGTSGGGGATGSGTSGGTLAFTGMPAPALKILGAGLLIMGMGLMLLAGPGSRARLRSLGPHWSLDR